MKKRIAVSGMNGQLGWELQQLATALPQFHFVFGDKATLNITDEDAVSAFFAAHRPDYFINTAAYTAVDKAETDQEFAFRTNAEAMGRLARYCSEYNTVLISFSTDYVFNGEGETPYRETDAIAPVNYYGYTKAMGEQLALDNWARTIIIRTSWVYSSHGHNFVKTMLRLMQDRSTLSVVADQVGAPTYAADLATATMDIITSGNNAYGVYHFSNEGVISWFEFAKAIASLSGYRGEVRAIATADYPTPAKRPRYSVLDKQKIVSTFQLRLRPWQQSLAACITKIKN